MPAGPSPSLVDAVVAQVLLNRDADLAAALLTLPTRAARAPLPASDLARLWSQTATGGVSTDHIDADALRAHLASLPAVVSTPAGPAKVADHLRLCCVRLVGASIEVHPPALTEAVRILTAILGQRFGGPTIEVRVPPVSAVQLGAFGQGPSHTRGTPPNVVETDPATFFELATGRVTLVDARDRVRSSGSHADDLARMLPVVEW